jgi:mono/diheme cytochrome c family protein
MKKSKFFVVLVAVSALLSSQVIWAEHFQGHAQVDIGKLSKLAKQGELLFNANCASCHGINAAGTREGPPLIHDIYNAGHHSSRSFYSAVKNGVRQHHWPYGDMPPQEQVQFSQIAPLIQFIREVQKQNGITPKPHKM